MDSRVCYDYTTRQYQRRSAGYLPSRQSAMATRGGKGGVIYVGLLLTL